MTNVTIRALLNELHEQNEWMDNHLKMMKQIRKNKGYGI